MTRSYIGSAVCTNSKSVEKASNGHWCARLTCDCAAPCNAQKIPISALSYRLDRLYHFRVVAPQVWLDEVMTA